MFHAQGLTQRFAPNRNLALPARPALAADLIPLRLPQGAMAYLGSSAPILLNGRSVNELLPGLLPLLRGDLDVAAVPAHAGPALRPAVHDLLCFLFARGLLVEHEDPPCLDTAAMRRHALFFGRYCSELSLAGGARPAQRLRDGQVWVVGERDGDLAPLQHALGELGLQVRALALEALTGATPASADAPVLALATPATLARLTPRQRAWAAAQGRRWLPVQVERQGLTLGPVLRDGREPCLDCLGPSGTPAATPTDIEPALWTSAAHMVLMVLADATTGHWGVNRLRLDAATLEWHSQGHARRLACRHCGSGVPEAAASFVAAYHLNTQDQPLRGNARQHLVSYEPAQVDKVRGAAKPYHGAHWRWDAPAAGADALDRLLAWAGLCVGWQRVGGLEPLRRVPSAGNLASQSLYLVNLRPGDARAGVHYLHPDGRAYRVAPAAQARQLAAALGGAQAGLVATAALARLESKYGHKAYRFAHYDAGVMLAALQALARDEAVELRCSADLDDATLETLLGLDGRTELVCWLATLPPASFTPTRTLHTDEVTTP